MGIPDWKSRLSGSLTEVLVTDVGRAAGDRRLVTATEYIFRKTVNCFFFFVPGNLDGHGSSTVETQGGNSKHIPDSAHIFSVTLRQLGVMGGWVLWWGEGWGCGLEEGGGGGH